MIDAQILTEIEEMEKQNLDDNHEDELGEQVQTGSITIGIIAVVGLFAGVTYYLLTRKNKLYKL